MMVTLLRQFLTTSSRSFPDPSWYFVFGFDPGTVWCGHTAELLKPPRPHELDLRVVIVTWRFRWGWPLAVLRDRFSFFLRLVSFVIRSRPRVGRSVHPVRPTGRETAIVQRKFRSGTRVRRRRGSRFISCARERRPAERGDRGVPRAPGAERTGGLVHRAARARHGRAAHRPAAHPRSGIGPRCPETIPVRPPTSGPSAQSNADMAARATRVYAVTGTGTERDRFDEVPARRATRVRDWSVSGRRTRRTSASYVDTDEAVRCSTNHYSSMQMSERNTQLPVAHFVSALYLSALFDHPR